jgi:hypothetical protein
LLVSTSGAVGGFTPGLCARPVVVRILALVIAVEFVLRRGGTNFKLRNRFG